MQEEYSLVTLEGTTYGFIQVENIPEKTLYLMKLLEDNQCEILKYYWRSLIDPNHIEYLEPKIYDAFFMCIDVRGMGFDIKNTMYHYTKNKQEREYLHRCIQKSLISN